MLDPPVQVGYWVAPWARDRGYATHALRLLTRWAFDRPGIDRLELLTKIGNVRSERVASNAGFELADEIRDHRPANARDDRLHHVKRWVLFPHRCHL